MEKDQIIARLEELGRFRHNIDLPHGLTTWSKGKNIRKGDETRIQGLTQLVMPAILNHFGGSLAGKRVLDIACCCGGLSIAAARHGAEQVLGVDVIQRYVEQSTFLAEVLELQNVDFQVMDIYDLSPETVGTFDVVFCCGLFFHLENPVDAMRRVASVARDVLVVETVVHRKEPSDMASWKSDIVRPTLSENTQTTSSGAWRTGGIYQLVPNEPAIQELIQFAGFDHITKLNPGADNPRAGYFKNKQVAYIAVQPDSNQNQGE